MSFIVLIMLFNFMIMNKNFGTEMKIHQGGQHSESIHTSEDSL